MNDRLSTCTLTVHGLLHIPDAIEMAGPQWCYWAYPMERYCGRLQPGIRSRRFPFASLDRHVLETARIAQIGVLHNVSDELALRTPRSHDPRGSKRVESYQAALLLGPHKDVPLKEIPNYRVLLSALATRFNLIKALSVLKNRVLVNAYCTEWSKIRRVDSTAGDTMVAYNSPSVVIHHRQDGRDATFVRYEMYVDVNEDDPNAPVELEPQSFYGRLQHIYLIELNNPHDIELRRDGRETTIPAHTSLIMVEIESCDITHVDERLDLPFYKKTGRSHMIDATALACLVGRVPDGQGGWAFVDRSGSLARAWYLDDLEDD
uniref:Uncharacterized protein n=1 Tax=Mycena chlorophos TaxID=658473 RepID=A0ABQ0L398_MYCCL|nr:predicted protein [Mycena chlorophos]